MTAAQIRQALDRKACPTCFRRTLIAGMFFTRHAHCLWCGTRTRLRIGFRRGTARLELSQPRVARQNGARRA